MLPRPRYYSNERWNAFVSITFNDSDLDAAPSDNLSALIKEARRRQRQRHVAVGTLTAVIVLTAAAVLDANASTPHPRTIPNEMGGRAFAPLGASRHEMIAYLFTTNGADFNSAARFLSRLSITSARLESACLTSRGARSDVRVTGHSSLAGDNAEFPDLSRIASGGFAWSGPRLPVASATIVTADATRHLRLIERQCAAVAAAVLAPIDASPLRASWQSDTIPAIDQSSAFQHSLVTWRSCMNTGGVEAKSISDFFAYADRNGFLTSGRRSDLPALYARCVASTEALRVSLRQVARNEALLRDAAAIARLDALLARLA